MNKHLSITSANALVSTAPEDLAALTFCRREPSGQTVSLFVVGDMGLSGKVNATAQQKGFGALLGDIVPLFQGGDIVFGNLETSLLGQAPPDSLFAASSQMISVLTEANFSMLHLANNHIYDYGPEGLRSTLEACRASGIIPLGAGNTYADARQLLRTDRKSVRIGWLGCGRTLQDQADIGPHFWEFDEDSLRAAIKRDRETVDVLIVSIHIGLMYLDYPRPDHKAMAERLLSDGANLVLMHHAHMLQGVQITVDGKVVCYNLGNFLFDWEEGNVRGNIMVEEQNEGAVFGFELDNKGVCSAVALPTFIDEDRCVRWAIGQQGVKIINRLTKISKDLDHDYSNLFFMQRAERNTGITLEVMWFHIRLGNWLFIWDSLKNVRLEHLSMFLKWFLSSIISKSSRMATRNK